jgi:hypothetical protein
MQHRRFWDAEARDPDASTSRSAGSDEDGGLETPPAGSAWEANKMARDVVTEVRNENGKVERRAVH